MSLSLKYKMWTTPWKYPYCCLKCWICLFSIKLTKLDRWKEAVSRKLTTTQGCFHGSILITSQNRRVIETLCKSGHLGSSNLRWSLEKTVVMAEWGSWHSIWILVGGKRQSCGHKSWWTISSPDCLRSRKSVHYAILKAIYLDKHKICQNSM